jgi:hypothetical protein
LPRSPIFGTSSDAPTADLCRWLHAELERLPAVENPFDLNRLPENGIYFFYEKGEVWGHGGERLRIVRIGTHREGNFRSRIAEHFLFNEWKMNFDATRPPPHDRSIFRKNIGRALLNRSHSPYLVVWNIDFTKNENAKKHGGLRDIGEERRIEAEVTRILREKISSAERLVSHATRFRASNSFSNHAEPLKS